jgi:hypothetical protein
LKEAKYIIGIDLGTTHSVLAYTNAQLSDGEEPVIHLFQIPQLSDPGQVANQPLLPSFILVPGPHDVPEHGLQLPWARKPGVAVGEFARRRGAELPHRLISSAKSWLSYSGVDRTQPLLPWNSPLEVARLSPLSASTLLLEHLRDAWNYVMAGEDPEARLEEQDIYLTVPASFDAVARELTVQAARDAGLARLTLLEEPQSAFYAWIESQQDLWRKAVRVGQTILVCDIGGGTTDFSLIQVTEENGELGLRRVAVGDHILLGGDNMDLTLAYKIQAKLAKKGTKLDAWQFRGLWQSCRTAKERLLGNPDLDSEPVVVLGRGTSLIGGTIRTELTREETEEAILDGFFPQCEAADSPREKTRVGMKELGLPYEADPAITRHLAKFLGRQISGHQEDGSSLEYPTAVLFNGGVMKSLLIRERLLSALRHWQGEGNITELPAVNFDVGVARGASYYGLAGRGRGIRVKAGSARSYYIGIESAMPSVPGVPTPIKALCVVPFGMEEGTDTEIREREFGLVVGQTALFQLLASTMRRGDLAGEVVEDWAGEIDPVTEMEALLPAIDTEEKGNIIPVWLQSLLTEIGTLELWCVSRDANKRWKLEFNLRGQQQR